LTLIGALVLLAGIGPATGTVEPTVGPGRVTQDTVPADSMPAGPAGATRPCRVVRVVDGDTIECAGLGRVRLIGMDTPEQDQAPYGRMATEALIALLPEDRTVELELDVERRDRYGRVLAYLWTDGAMLNWQLVRRGWAVVLTYPPNVRYVDWFIDAQRRARADEVGLWATSAFDCRPIDRRRGRC
jgi:micrococcal nuclease